MDVDEDELREFCGTVLPLLDERQRRIAVGALSRMLGKGGQAAVTRASGLSRNTVIDGEREVDSGVVFSDRIRAEGGGRPSLIDIDPDLLRNLDDLVEPDSRGDPMSPLRWTLKSTRQLAAALREMGHQVSSWSVGKLLRQMGYSLQANAKVLEGAQHPDRNAQFEYINKLAAAHQGRRQPVISVDAKKKELVNGTKVNKGREWEPKGRPVRVDDHDFPDPEIPKAVPYGVYDVESDEGWLAVGDDHDTAAFAVNAIRRWWQEMGSVRYPKAKEILVTADAGGSNGYRNRLWKKELNAFADETGLKITVCHYPPGTSKWNKVEHRFFSFISMNWRARPLTSYRAIVELAAATTTTTGLKVQSEWDQNTYPTGTIVTDNELQSLDVQPHEWHGEWNYTFAPAKKRTATRK